MLYNMSVILIFLQLKKDKTQKIIIWKSFSVSALLLLRGESWAHLKHGCTSIRKPCGLINHQWKMHLTFVMNSTILKPFTTFMVCCLRYCMMCSRHNPELFNKHQMMFCQNTKVVKAFQIGFNFLILCNHHFEG